MRQLGAILRPSNNRLVRHLRSALTRTELRKGDDEETKARARPNSSHTCPDSVRGKLSAFAPVSPLHQNGSRSFRHNCATFSLKLRKTATYSVEIVASFSQFHRLETVGVVDCSVLVAERA